MIKKDCWIYRVSVTFSGDEAALVKKALGNEPANAILGWCQAAILSEED